MSFVGTESGASRRPFEESLDQPITTMNTAATAMRQLTISDEAMRIDGADDEERGINMIRAFSGGRIEGASDQRHDREEQGDRQGAQQDVSLRESPARGTRPGG